MLSGIALLWRQARQRAFGRIGELKRDERGFTAVEFAMVAAPFLALLFGIIGVGLFFFVTFSLENAVEQAGRMLRTGEAQQAGMTTDQFKQEVCSRSPTFIDCSGKMRVNVNSWQEFSQVVPPSCLDVGGKLVPDPPTNPVQGDASWVVLITVCYQWDLAGSIPFLRTGNMANGAALIQASTTFRTEPYN